MLINFEASVFSTSLTSKDIMNISEAGEPSNADSSLSDGKLEKGNLRADCLAR